MTKVHDPYGFAALKAALQPQEGRFMRNATWIANSPKDYGEYNVTPNASPSKKKSDNERVGRALLERNAKGQFVREPADDTFHITKRIVNDDN